MKFYQWHNDRALTLLRTDMNGHGDNPAAVAIMFNATDAVLSFSLPTMTSGCEWKLVFHSAETPPPYLDSKKWNLEPRSIACAIYD